MEPLAPCAPFFPDLEGAGKRVFTSRNQESRANPPRARTRARWLRPQLRARRLARLPERQATMSEKVWELAVPPVPPEGSFGSSLHGGKTSCCHRGPTWNFNCPRHSFSMRAKSTHIRDIKTARPSRV